VLTARCRRSEGRPTEDLTSDDVHKPLAYLPDRSWGVVTPQLAAELQRPRRGLGRSLTAEQVLQLHGLYVRLVLAEVRLSGVAAWNREDMAA
jgi:hypothetical protein